MYSTPKKVNVVEFYVANNSVVVAQQMLCQCYNVHHLALPKTFKSIAVKFKTKEA